MPELAMQTTLVGFDLQATPLPNRSKYGYIFIFIEMSIQMPLGLAVERVGRVAGIDLSSGRGLQLI